MIICDTREQKNQHILKYFAVHKIPFTVRKLDIADYMLEGNDRNLVDRKQNLDELLHNLFSKDKRRFLNEMRTACENGMQITIICEHGGRIRTEADISRWKSRRSKVTGKTLRAEIERLKRSYGVQFIFCTPQETAKRIIETLEVC